MKSTSTPSQGVPAFARKSGENGFSLLEVIVALAIMAMGFTAVLNLFSSSIRSVGMSDQYLKAVTLANSKMSELELMDLQNETAAGVFKNENGFRWELNVNPYDSPLNDPESGINLSEVLLKVLWKDGSKSRNVELATLRMDGSTHPGNDRTLLAAFSGGATPPADTPEEPGEDANVEAPSFQAPGSAPCQGGQHVSGAASGCGAVKPHISGN